MGYRTIDAAEKNKDILLQIKGKTLIGWAFLEMGQAADALSWHLKALRTTNDTLLLAKYGILFANLALNYNGMGKTDSAFYFINKAIRYSRQHENRFALSNSLAIQAQLFVRDGQASKAEAPLTEVVEIRKLIGDPFYIVSDMSQLGLYYANNGQPQKGIEICNEGIAIARQYKIDTKLIFLYNSLAENYKAAGNDALYASTLEKILILKDSVFQNNSALSLAEMQTKYETEKNQLIIAQQKLSLIKKNYWLYGSIGLLVAGIIIAFLVFSNYRRKQKLKSRILLEEQKFSAAQAIDRAKENERKRIAAELHDNLGAYAASLSSNLGYLQHEYTDSKAGQAFAEIKSNSNAIISELNDTIWVLKKDMLSLTAISDRIKVFINHIRKSYPHINVDVEELIETDHRLPSARAFHLYRVVQEAITNALRHSGARNIVVKISSAKNWFVSITDDGMGFKNASVVNGSGNGLENMKERSMEAGWDISWQPGEKNGTVVAINGTTY
jgi:signal transduction histidine kinase